MEVIFSEVIMLVLFEETSNFFNVRLFNIPWKAWLGKFAVLGIALATLAHIINTERQSQFLWENGTLHRGRVLEVEHTHF